MLVTVGAAAFFAVWIWLGLYLGTRMLLQPEQERQKYLRQYEEFRRTHSRWLTELRFPRQKVRYFSRAATWRLRLGGAVGVFVGIVAVVALVDAALR